MYKNRFSSKSPYVVTYFHSGLNKYSRHFVELVDKLKDQCDPNVDEKLSNLVISRVAAYKSGDWRSNPTNLTLFDTYGNRLDSDMLDRYEGIIIAEGLQFELNLEVENQKELKQLLRLLKLVVNSYNLDKYGRIRKDGNVPQVNPISIHDAWDIPLVTVYGAFKYDGFLTCREFILDGKNSQASILVRKKRRKLEDELCNKSISYLQNRRAANRLFVEEYLDM